MKGEHVHGEEHPLSKLHHQRFDGIAASNPPELAVKMLRRFLGIAFVVFLDDFNQPCLDRKFDTRAIERGYQLKRSSKREGGRAESRIFPAQPLVTSEDGTAQEIVNEDGDNGEKRRRKRKIAAEIEKMDTHRNPSGPRAKFQSREWKSGTRQPGLRYDAGPLLEELSAAEGRWALEGCGKGGSVRRAASILECQRREKGQRRNDAEEEKRQNGQPCPVVRAVGVRDKHQDEGYTDCDCRNQEPSAPISVLKHC